MGRLIIISNRLPISVDRVGDDIVIRQSSGGLVSAIKSYFERSDIDTSQYSEAIWLGTMDAAEEDWNAANEMGGVPSDFKIETIFTDKDVYDGFYNGFANSTLWPLFHYFPSLVEYKKEYFEAYLKVNQQFADKLVEIYQPGDTIWIHDYQLMSLSKLIRKRLPGATIGFFLHIPFPSYEIFRLLPTVWKHSILEGMLGADLIGFHTYDYVQHFIQSIKMVLKVDSQFNTINYNGRVIKTDLFPIGIDYQKFREAINDEKTIRVGTSLEERFYNKKIIFSVDRLDYTKGVSFRLEGYEEFLEKHPEWMKKVVFILNIIPSRDLIAAYIERKKLIEEKISTINGRFSTLEWQPIIYRYNHLSFEELCALYQIADVALITPLRDGMNLVAKEYVASCIDKGVLILSELTGAASELNEAILVNPTDCSEVADAIQTALTMPLMEQRSLLSHMQKRLKDYDVVKWINDFLEQLVTVKKDQEKLVVKVLDGATIKEMLQRYQSASKRCIMLDYDGTLAPITKLPSMAVPDDNLLGLMTQLSGIENNEIVIISGRDADTLQEWLGHLPITLVAEHGALTRFKGEEWQQKGSYSADWKDKVRPLLELFVSRCAGSFTEEKKNTLAWHYRNTAPDLGFIRSRELMNSLQQLTTNTPLQVVDGNKVLEVRMIGVDKGATAINLVDHFKPDFIMCIGDDTTDEDMFKALNDKAYTIKIGKANTAAQHTLLLQTEVLPLLKQFVACAKKEEYGFSHS